jgi:dTDP-4-dehydrorhamnose reductase
MKVLLTGASGMLGTWMRRTCPEGIELTSVVHESGVDGPVVAGDLTDRQSAGSIVDETGPDVVVHLAYRLDRTSIVQTTANLASTGCPLILASTDAVFAGDDRLRAETDEPDPVWDYGRWKVEAEGDAVRVGGVVVRLPLMCSFDPDDATTAAIRESVRGGDEPGWYRDEVRLPAWAEDVSNGLWRITTLSDKAGTWHLMGPEAMTRPDMAAALAHHLGIVDWGRSVPSPPPEMRPRTLLLSDDRARKEIGWSPRSIR